MSELLTVEQCATKAQCSPRSIKRQILAGRLKVVRIGSLVRIRPSDWEEYLCRSGATAPAGKSASSTVAEDIVRLLQHVPTPTSLKRGYDSSSTILELAGYRNTRSRKGSKGG